MPKHLSSNLLKEFGKYDDIFEIIDLNIDDLESKKNYLTLIKRCEELENKISSFYNICERFNVKSVPFSDYKSFLNKMNLISLESNKELENLSIDSIENIITSEEKIFKEFYNNYNFILNDIEIMKERKAVYTKLFNLFGSNNNFNKADFKNIIKQSFVDLEMGKGSIDFIAGIAATDDMPKMSRMVMRNSRGRAIIQTFDYEPNDSPYLEEIKKDSNNDKDNISLRKTVFIIISQASDESLMMSKMIKICDLINASRFKIPESGDYKSIIDEINKTILDQEQVLKETRLSALNFIGQRAGNDLNPSIYEFYKEYIKIEKLTYISLNKCKLRENFIDCEIFTIPENEVKIRAIADNLITKLENSDEISSFSIHKIDNHDNTTIPTYIKTNEFTYVFQQIVDLYGIPRYKEINPALFNIITFPFLFGVMFGDILHGLILFFIGLYFVINSNSIKLDKTPSSQNLKLFLPVRYLFLMMGFFSLYAGLIYNDFASIPLPLGYTCYKNQIFNNYEGNAIKTNKNCNYLFGIDHKWYSTSNELAFVNSMKMKLSVIFGVFHMLLGIFLKGLNLLYFNHKLDFCVEFVPQLVFFIVIFVQMDILIIIKWLTSYGDLIGHPNAPSITSTVLNIFLNAGFVKSSTDDNGNTKYEPVVWMNKISLQEYLHFSVFIIALLCIFTMLLVKPFVIGFKSKKNNNSIVSKNNNYLNKDDINIKLIDDENSNKEIFVKENISNEDEGFGNLLMHQAIETIEFVLGSISNTASYLRLWALSLAHSQLSKVFFEKTVKIAFSEDINIAIKIIIFYLGFIALSGITFGVLLCMDMLECFLHTLRLHWVEFQNKFFKGDGIKYNPLSFKNNFSNNSL